MLRKTFLKNHRKGHTRGCAVEKLDSHLAEIDQTAREQVEAVTVRMAREQGVTEALKARGPINGRG